MSQSRALCSLNHHRISPAARLRKVVEKGPQKEKPTRTPQGRCHAFWWVLAVLKNLQLKHSVLGGPGMSLVASKLDLCSSYSPWWAFLLSSHFFHARSFSRWWKTTKIKINKNKKQNSSSSNCSFPSPLCRPLLRFASLRLASHSSFHFRSSHSLHAP